MTLESLDAANAVRAEKGAAPIKEGSELHRAMSWVYQHALAKGEDVRAYDTRFLTDGYTPGDFNETPDFYYASYALFFTPLMVLDYHEELAPIGGSSAVAVIAAGERRACWGACSPRLVRAIFSCVLEAVGTPPFDVLLDCVREVPGNGVCDRTILRQNSPRATPWEC